MKSSTVLASLFSLVLCVGCSHSATPTGPTSTPADDGVNAQAGRGTLPLEGRLEGTATVTPLTPPMASVEVNATGQATLVGRFQISLPHTVNFATSSAQGICTITAANGDVITADFTGQAQVGPIVSIVEQATITGGTGRFAGASGSFTIRRLFNPADGVTTGTMEGAVTITHVP